MNTDVAIIRCEVYERSEVLSALRNAMELCPPPDIRGKKVLLKPNILRDSPPETAITTHPEFVRAAVQLFRELGAEVFVGDSPGLHPAGSINDACGIRRASEAAGAKWVDFSAEQMTLRVPQAKRLKKFTLARIFEQVDLVVSLPKMKTHTLMYYTGAMKNLFGLIPGTLKASFHARFPGREAFARVMIDLNCGISAGYALMDGIMGMEGAGPGKSGKPRRIGIVMASRNLLAMDIIASGIMGYEPMDLPMNRDALERGIWLTSVDEIGIKGVPPEEVKPAGFRTVPQAKRRNAVLEYLLTNFSMILRSRRRPIPEFSKDICIACGECIEICPADALSFCENGVSKYIKIDSRACVRCYCCHEICPVGAVSVEEPPPRG